MKSVSESVRADAEVKGGEWLYRQLRRLPKSIQPQVLKPEDRIASWKETEERLRSEVLTAIDNLRYRGVMFVAAVPNQPNDHQLKDDKWILPTIHPGVIGVGGIAPAQKYVPEAGGYVLEDKPDAYARIGYPQLAQVTGIGFGKSPYYMEPYIEGNSYATPMVAIGIGMIMSKFTELKSIKDPRKRELAVLNILEDANQPLQVKEMAKTGDGEFVAKQATAQVLSLEILKELFKKNESQYRQNLWADCWTDRTNCSRN